MPVTAPRPMDVGALDNGYLDYGAMDYSGSPGGIEVIGLGDQVELLIIETSDVELVAV
jgi:hypothetical protein